ncbi:FAD binding domain protein [Polyplosphaeria fusca]|uniref:Delta(24)-sterol reductase n=1 Tax=Polyplosphaeria fusca TaxID=682080 RepID=A0A9P4R5R1_9PLEO|nr:FAD binding domain protein [Polyplosphaeria fusca]
MEVQNNSIEFDKEYELLPQINFRIPGLSIPIGFEMASYTRKNHDIAIQQLSVQVREFYASKTPFRINHGSTNSTRIRAAGTPELKIAHLNHVLFIDPSSRIAIVEPNVPVDAPVAATLPMGFLPPVVMEFPGITVGGGFSGASGESSSWREGMFDCGIKSIKIILGNREIILAEKDGENANLFTMACCSLGTLGVVTLLTVNLIEAKPYVQTTYHRTSSITETIEKTAFFCESEYAKKTEPGRGDMDFIEAIQYTPSVGVIITGKFASRPHTSILPITRFDRAHDPWFYKHALSSPDAHTELIPTTSYLFRHDRGAFWSGETFFDYFRLPNARFWRWLFNPALTTRAIYTSQAAAGGPETNIVQDLLLPVNSAVAFANYVADELAIWPVRICPVRRKAEDVWGWPVWKHIDAAAGEQAPPSKAKDELVLNFGVWGQGPADPVAFRAVNRSLEERLRELRGTKVLYVFSFYTEDEFWGLCDRKVYEEARRKWHAEALPSVYEKVRREPRGVVGGKNGLGEKVLWWVLGIWPIGGILMSL